MSISGAMSNALSGLTAASRAAETVSSNLSNIMNENYGRRDLNLSSRVIGSYGGVTVHSQTRHVDKALLNDKRFAMADHAFASGLASFHSRLEGLYGDPTDSRSLTSKIAGFESSLVLAASMPESNQRLDAVVSRAKDIATTLKKVSDGIQQSRNNADREIETTVSWLNTALSQVSDLNGMIVSANALGNDVSSLEDNRQKLISQISEIIPVREVPRDRGAVVLYSAGGAILLDSSPAKLAFTPANFITPHMTQANGLLSGLTISGMAVDTDRTNGPISGGKLAALFNVRDTAGVAAQTEIDSVARDLVERFQAATVDTTRAVGDPGLFTDSGTVFDPADEVGLAGRLAVNSAVDPAKGGEVWRIRDGLGAAAPGAAGDASLLQSLQQTLTDLRSPASGSFTGTSRSFASLGAGLLSQAGAQRETMEIDVSFANIRLGELTTRQLEDGVDSDYEMQRLMLVEQSYAANARMIETIDEMMKTLLRL